MINEMKWKIKYENTYDERKVEKSELVMHITSRQFRYMCEKKFLTILKRSLRRSLTNVAFDTSLSMYL